MIRQILGALARKITPKGYIKYWQIRTRINGKRCFQKAKRDKNNLKQIVVIGDSHSRFFSGATPETEVTVHWDENGEFCYNAGPDRRFCSFKLGPALAFNLTRGGATRALEKYKWLSQNLLNKGDILICVFGEIDVRMHVFKHVTEEKSYKSVIDEICDHYVEFLKIVKEDGFHPIVWGPIASQKDEWRRLVDPPAIGAEQDRNMATEYFNQRMKKECDANGWGFMSIFESLIDGDYRTRAEYICDKCHLGSNAKPLLEGELEKLGLK